jgi:hypothetical protein
MVVHIISTLPAVVWTSVFLSRLMYGCITLYAIHRKGNFSLEYSHGRTTFKLEAKERSVNSAL